MCTGLPHNLEGEYCAQRQRSKGNQKAETIKNESFVMHIPSARTGFFDSQEAKDIRQRFQSMADSSSYNTESSYTANGILHPDNLISFVDKHMNYLNSHPMLDAEMYLNNVRLMTLIR